MEERFKGNKIANSILAQIKKGKVSMRPRWQFVLQAALAGVGLAIVGVMLIYLLSFVIYIMREEGFIWMPLHGSRELLEFFRLLPWLLILSSIIFFGILELLVRKYSFAYKKPLIYSLLIILTLSLAASIFMSQIGVHERLERFARERNLPVFDPIYRHFVHHQDNDWDDSVK